MALQTNWKNSGRPPEPRPKRRRGPKQRPPEMMTEKAREMEIKRLLDVQTRLLYGSQGRRCFRCRAKFRHKRSRRPSSRTAIFHIEHGGPSTRHALALVCPDCHSSEARKRPHSDPRLQSG